MRQEEDEIFRGNVQKKIIFKDIIQIKVDHPPSYPILTNYFLTRIKRITRWTFFRVKLVFEYAA